MLLTIEEQGGIICLVERMWRNWQTHKTQNLAVATSCGFKSHHPHFDAKRKQHFVVSFFLYIYTDSLEADHGKKISTY